VICRGPECGDHRGSAPLFEQFRAALVRHGLANDAEVAWQSCFGRCTQGPNVLVREIVDSAAPTLGSGFATAPGPRGVTALYNRIDATRIDRVITEHVMAGKVVRDFIEPTGILGSYLVGSKQKDSKQ